MPHDEGTTFLFQGGACKGRDRDGRFFCYLKEPSRGCFERETSERFCNLHYAKSPCEFVAAAAVGASGNSGRRRRAVEDEQYDGGKP